MAEETMPERPPHRFRRMLRRHFGWFEGFFARHSWGIAISTIVVVFGILYLLPMMVYDIGPGQLGVRWYRFLGGTDTKHTLGEGIHVIAPWDRVYIYDVRLQREERDFDVLSSDGLPMTVRIAWRYQIIPSTLGLLHKFVGPNYNDVMIAPDIAERARDILATNRPQEIWSQRRPEIEKEILDAVRYNLHTNLNPVGLPPVDFIHLEDVLMTGVTLPNGVQDAIIAKQTADQDQQKFDYILQKEKKEADRKRIEASGIRAFQDVISYGLTDSYLRWRGIEATLELAKSNNSKVVIIGNPTNGLPLILGNLDDKAGAAAAPQSPAQAATPTTPRPLEPTPTAGAGDAAAQPTLRPAGPTVPGTSPGAGPPTPGSSPHAGPPQPGAIAPLLAPAGPPPTTMVTPPAAPPSSGAPKPTPATPAPNPASARPAPKPAPAAP
jgi:regulator of protease activity HflC (stomatin/prohibitin superfamily)